MNDNCKSNVNGRRNGIGNDNGMITVTLDGAVTMTRDFILRNF